MSKYVYSEDTLPTPQNVKLLAMVGHNKSVLEVGCALGYQSRSLKELQGCRVTGFEIDEEAAKSASIYCERVVVGDIEKADLKRELGDRKYDVITFADVLEHLKDPNKALSKIKDFLAEDGFVLASIPNITHSSVIFEMANGRFDYQDRGLLDNTHIRFFTKKTIYSMFEEAGYLITETHRNIRHPSSTEFNTLAITEEDRQLLDYISKRNEESETYQFIVKAIPANQSALLQSEIISIQEKLRLSTIDNASMLKTISRLESENKWLENSRLYKIFKKAKRIIGE